jgi:phenylpropionate dioxygenase-like ring-hydroxylating dioxygenase large terminal subunit
MTLETAKSSPDSEAIAAPRPAWYAALASQRLAQGPVAARVLDHDLALWRDASGAPRAVHDSCLHRGTQLSLGEVTDGVLACRYHGWRYGADGACVHIPSLVAGQEIPKGFGLRAFPCAERDGYIWAWAGEGTPDRLPTPVDGFDRFHWIQGVLILRTTALAVIENNLDWCHPVFAHPNTHGQFFINQALGFRESEIEMRLTDRGLVVFAPVTANEADPIPDVAMVRLEYDLPDRVTAGFAAGPTGETRIVMHMVPTARDECRQEWMVSMGPVSAGEAQRLTWSDEPQPIFEQDRAVMESAQRAIAREGHGFERSVDADAPTLLARRVWTAAAQGKWPKAGARRILKIRT